jgi:DNA-binding NtrC family response regulator
MDADVLKALTRYPWPGNVRELRNMVERSLILGRFPDDLRGKMPGASAGDDTLEDVERRHILSVLDDAGGNRDEAARKLGISRKTIDRKAAAWHG